MKKRTKNLIMWSTYIVVCIAAIVGFCIYKAPWYFFPSVIILGLFAAYRFYLDW